MALAVDEREDQISISAPLWRRFMALLYDSFLLGALTMLYSALVTYGLFIAQGDTSKGDYRPMLSGAQENTLFLLGLTMTLAAFYVFFWWRAGQTVGMRAWRLKLISTDVHNVRQAPRVMQCVLRAVLGIPAFFLLGAGYWWRWFDRDELCLHDRGSQTAVVVVRRLKKR